MLPFIAAAIAAAVAGKYVYDKFARDDAPALSPDRGSAAERPEVAAARHAAAQEQARLLEATALCETREELALLLERHDDLVEGKPAARLSLRQLRAVGGVKDREPLAVLQPVTQHLLYRRAWLAERRAVEKLKADVAEARQFAELLHEDDR